MRQRFFLLLFFLFLMAGAGVLYAHCEIPCGIYGDSLRFELIREHVLTVEKSMREIEAIGKSKKPDLHQLVRWVDNKEEHARLIQDIVSQYFLHQRIKPIAEGEPGRELYVRKLELMHRILVSAMKCKQGTDLQDAARIREDLHCFEDLYWEEHGHAH
ncbi:MAG: superoxide dismutase [Ni] [bacterium]|jgi:nickel superoxide dismutase|nr:superoxide dismutase [Ni] [bacterium]